MCRSKADPAVASSAPSAWLLDGKKILAFAVEWFIYGEVDWQYWQEKLKEWGPILAGALMGAGGWTCQPLRGRAGVQPSCPTLQLQDCEDVNAASSISAAIAHVRQG